MGIIINLDERRKKKEDIQESEIVKAMRSSLDNEEVKKRYKIQSKKPGPTIEERAENIRQSIARINNLMAELHDNTTAKDKTK